MARIELLPLFVFLGILGWATSLEDIRTRKIRNGWIVTAVVFTFWFYFLTFMIFRDRYDDLATQITRDVLVNGAIALGVGFAFWKMGLWPPGDGKLFFAYALLVPLGYYSHGYLPYFPSLALLINAFAAAFFYLVVRTMLAGLTGSNLRRHVAKIKSLGTPQGRSFITSALWKRRDSLLRRVLTASLVLLVMTGVREVWLSTEHRTGALLYYLLFMMVYGTFRRELEAALTIPQLVLLNVFFPIGWAILLEPARLPTYFSNVARLAVPLVVFGVGLGGLVRLFLASLDEQSRPDEGGDSRRGRRAPDRRGASESHSSTLPFAPFLFAGVLLTLLLKQSVVHLALSLVR